MFYANKYLLSNFCFFCKTNFCKFIHYPGCPEKKMTKNRAGNDSRKKIPGRKRKVNSNKNKKLVEIHFYPIFTSISSWKLISPRFPEMKFRESEVKME